MHLILLLATLAALLCGPLLHAAGRRHPGLQRGIDLFVLVGVTLLVLIEALPETLEAGGPWSLGFLLLGLAGPSLIEHALSGARRGTHLATLALAVLGLLAHSFGDGAALSPAGAANTGLALAVVLHSVPVGLLVWWLLSPISGNRTLPALTLAAMCASTVAGYLTGPQISAGLDATGWAYFQALVAGSILHVVFGRPHSRPEPETAQG